MVAPPPPPHAPTAGITSTIKKPQLHTSCVQDPTHAYTPTADSTLYNLKKIKSIHTLFESRFTHRLATNNSSSPKYTNSIFPINLQQYIGEITIIKYLSRKEHPSEHP
jgi:hypothetical protein